MNLFFRAKPKIPASTTMEIDGVAVAIAVKVNARSKSYRLSLPSSGPVLTLPPHGKWAEAEAFLHRHHNWLAARIKRVPEATSFAEGTLVPLRGVDHRIIATGRVRGRVEVAELDGEKVLLVPGDAAHQARRLTDWLKDEALADLEIQSAYHAERLGVSIKAIRMREQKSRWGSCSSTGNINYNWRLILAPPFVLDYVAAHEVAHLVEMNHSAAFWAQVKKTLPDMEKGRAWLKAHGRQLMA
ncbi:MAG: SprT family zinc-dependent metalloprotease [Candidatus Devosia phytovorans]|uniref:SprT family zinc-dependent metalloprotease n=1 Tax=Candidatus Devosia phytovorans TaxID=3121372 RepID=A0AAJ5VSD6_9HYPH|nr:SprT family zinc-dependent metalloprotease [Devosia sp.]WEK03941.1 MAG: SprT family zinc-dependent metalloprotease [Devosia sp.]